MTSFKQLISSFENVPDTWLQGRTLFGGASVGIALGEDVQNLHSLQVNFVAPISGSVDINRRVLREGRSATFVHHELSADDQTALSLSAVFGPRRESVLNKTVPNTTPMPREDGVEMPYIDGLTPAFTQNFSYFWCDGMFPYSNVETSHLKGWCRHQTESPADVRSLLALIDSWPCPALSMLKIPAPASSVNWSVAILQELETYDGWFWFESEAYHIDGGFAQMNSTIFDEEGRALATSHQLVAVFG